MIIELGSHY